MKNGNDKYVVRGSLLSDQLNDAEIYLLKSLKNHPHRFDPTASEAPIIALMISKLFTLDLVHVDKDEEGHEAVVSLSCRGLNSIIENQTTSMIYFQ